MAEINEIEQRLNERIAFNGVTSIEDQDMLALIKEVRRLQTFDNWSVMDHERMKAELETVRVQRDALRAALNHVLEIAYNGRGFTTITAKNAAFGAIKDVIGLATAALNTQPPQAEWTPAIDGKARVKWTGVHVTIADILNGRAQIITENNIAGWIDIGELAPVDESEV